MDLCRERPQLSNSFRSSDNALLFPRFLLTSFQRSAHSVTVLHTCSSVDRTSLQCSRYTRHGDGEAKSCWVVFSTSTQILNPYSFWNLINLKHKGPTEERRKTLSILKTQKWDVKFRCLSQLQCFQGKSYFLPPIWIPYRSVPREIVSNSKSSLFFLGEGVYFSIFFWEYSMLKVDKYFNLFLSLNSVRSVAAFNSSPCLSGISPRTFSSCIDLDFIPLCVASRLRISITGCCSRSCKNKINHIATINKEWSWLRIKVVINTVLVQQHANYGGEQHKSSLTHKQRRVRTLFVKLTDKGRVKRWWICIFTNCSAMHNLHSLA